MFNLTHEIKLKSKKSKTMKKINLLTPSRVNSEGYFSEIYKLGTAGTQFMNSIPVNAAFEASWSGPDFIYIHKGKTTPQKKIPSFNEIFLKYSITYNGEPGSFVAAQAWLRNPTIEVFILQAWEKNLFNDYSKTKVLNFGPLKLNECGSNKNYGLHFFCIYNKKGITPFSEKETFSIILVKPEENKEAGTIIDSINFKSIIEMLPLPSSVGNLNEASLAEVSFGVGGMKGNSGTAIVNKETTLSVN